MGYDTKGLPICTASELYNEYEGGHRYRIIHIYKTGSGFDISGILTTENFCIPIPEIVTTVDTFLDDNEIINIINSGKVGFRIYTYQRQYNPTIYYTIDWVDYETGAILYGKEDFKRLSGGTE